MHGIGKAISYLVILVVGSIILLVQQPWFWVAVGIFVGCSILCELIDIITKRNASSESDRYRGYRDGR